MPLNALIIKSAKPKDKKYRLSDSGGLYMEVTPSGGKLWRMKYRFLKKEKLLSFGAFPIVTLKEARLYRDEAKSLLSKGIDPSVVKKELKESKLAASKNSFKAVTQEWISKNSTKWSSSNTNNVSKRLEQHVFPHIGNKSISTITAPDLLTVINRIEKTGTIYTAHKTLQNCGQVFRYAMATARCTTDPTTALKGALPPTQPKHHASITDPKKIGALLRAINGYEGNFITQCALKLAPLVFVRPGELRHAEWQEVDIEKAEWRIPAEKMKMKAVHIVPLSKQAIAILEDIYTVTGHGKYVFPSVRTNTRPMSENTVNAGLRRLGYTKEEITGHGFRSMASTLLNEQGWHWDAIERQLTHAERNSIRAAYNYAEHLPERIKMMQHYADYLDGLANGADIVSINKNRKT
ncbi:MAG: tyrosine-type recombinase/integrase [Cycloclasticus sp.]|uniref:tyrosine-type recombinase/integrase n=1 Tax=Cycloclasticus sp. TaxID=2024830 RepID=UPI002579FD39|nr:tyrosine-type recombinase/integrase [Cycloclasticus sp.]MBV1899841.1 tyrosine-type recombinase/integrase [Cycloclasticus sp.]